jgi:radical SAM superfamily enzyme YgiQ (UPF0313 family)
MTARGRKIVLAASHSPKIESIPRLRRRSTFGAVEITRGCGRGCQYLEFTGKRSPRFRVPDHVPIPEHTVRPVLPVL